MKKHPYSVFLLLVIVLFTLCLACNQQSDESNTISFVRIPDTIEGVWQLSSRYWVLDDDTLYADPTSSLQHKIYYDGYVMWTSDPAPDSTEWHGFGTYQLSNDTLIEKLLSMSLPMKLAMGAADEAILKIVCDSDFYKQEMEQVFRDTIYRAVEEFKRLN